MKEKIEAIKALIEVQKQVIGIDKDTKNPFFKSDYITYDAIVKGTRKVLTENGFAVLHSCEKTDSNMIHVKTSLIHVTGQSFDSTLSLPHDGKPQNLGSAMSYAKRYTLQSLLAIASGEDDDANMANEGMKVKQAKDKKDAQKEFEQKAELKMMQDKLVKLNPVIKDAMKKANLAGSTKQAYDYCESMNWSDASIVKDLKIEVKK